ncbi:hypothetical protein Leryth_004051 [Lithospermum erythrorhizon]|nr:hypothetical protein Leryth_004051 [Lithospermum erythrorhizon]
MSIYLHLLPIYKRSHPFSLPLATHNQNILARSYCTNLSRKVTITMNMKSVIAFFFLVLLIMSPVECLGYNSDYEDSIYSIYKNGGRVHARKLLMLDPILDYDDAGPNPKHDPRGRRGGRNP